MPTIRSRSTYNDDYSTDNEYDDFRDRCDIGEQCPACWRRQHASVAIDMHGSLWFHCDACRHEWRDPWKS